jgi:hypothetical protein
MQSVLFVAFCKSIYFFFPALFAVAALHAQPIPCGPVPDMTSFCDQACIICDIDGYTGIAWSIGGVHDRPWFNRPIFGSVRYMSRESTGKKCNATKYIEKINTLQSQPI